MDAENKKAMTEEEFNKWLSTAEGMFETPGGDPVICHEELTNNLSESDEITDETYEHLCEGGYCTDPVNLAVPLDCYIEYVNKIRDLAYKIEMAMSPKTIYSEDFIKYAAQDIQRIVAYMAL